MKTYTVVLEKDSEGKWTLTAPALPGYVACGDTREDVLALAREGIPFHLKCLRDEGLPAPEDQGDAEVIRLEIAA